MSSHSIKVTVEMPDLADNQAKAMAERKAREAAILALVDAEVISIGKGAEELGLTMHDMLDLMAAHGMPVVRGPLNPLPEAEPTQELASDRS
jgi:hypothetical protein